MRNGNGTFAKGSKHLVKHGKSKTAIYNTWSGMKSRCLNPNDKAYQNYGGRGITLCEQWYDFEQFYEDMGDRPEGCSLDRIDNDAGYCPENCRWTDRLTQSRNRRSTREITVNGVTRKIVEWAEIVGLDPRTIRARIRNGWTPEAAVLAKKVSRKGIPRGEKLRNHQEYGDRHGVDWSEPHELMNEAKAA